MHTVLRIRAKPDRCRALPNVSMPKNTMNVIVMGDTTVIDDTYNTNPDGLKSALAYISEAYPEHQKIIVFPGIIELGSSSEEIHTELGAEIGKQMHHFVISSADFSRPLIHGARLGGKRSRNSGATAHVARVRTDHGDQSAHGQQRLVLQFQRSGRTQSHTLHRCHHHRSGVCADIH